jgi:dTDP-glucose 4,6-dehydratase
MKILVTGGAGFIGSNFIFLQLQKYPQDSIICVDKLTYAGNLETLKNILNKPNFTFFKGDISSTNDMDFIFRKEVPDIVVNFAAESHVDRSIKNPEIFLITNILGTQVLLEMAKKYQIKRFHQVSTDEVYGDLPLNRKDLLFTESSPLHTSSPYSASKASADLLVQAYFRTYKIPITISRCSNNYGPFHFPEKLIPLVINQALNNKPIPVYGKGENVRDWLYVKDHCEAIDIIIRKSKIGEIYNIGGHNEKSNLDVIKIILKHLDKPESLIQYILDRPGHDLRYAINPNKINKELGWLPKTKFEDGIKFTIEWYLNNQTWVRSVLSGDYESYYKKHYGNITKT